MKLTKILAFLISVTFLGGCENPFKDLDIRVDTNVFKYTAMVEVKSSSGASLDNATVTLRGQDADKIYNADGKKIFKVNGGILLLALDPKVEPTDANPVKFSVDVTAPDYLPLNIPVEIKSKQNSMILSATMLNLKSLPEGVNIKTTAVPLAANGATSAPVTLSSSTGSGVTETVSIALPAGTQFKDAQGNTVSASSLSVSTLVGNTSSDDVLSLFPGGGLAVPQVKTSGGTTAAGSLLPAALTEISMTANNTPIKSFNQPIEITMQLSPDFHNPATNALVKAGDQLEVYSYSADQGIWNFEKAGTVVNEGGKLVLKTTTTHLTWFIAGSYVPECTNTYGVRFSASWLAEGITHPVSYKVFSVANGVKDKQLTQGTFTVANSSEGVISKLPSAPVIISYYDVAGNELAVQNVANPCSVNAIQLVTLSASPVAGNPKVTMQLYVRCPGNAQPVTLLPTFYLYYKEVGTPASNYKLVGTVTKGYISTTLLSTSKVYDFKAIWGSYVKYATAKTVSADNTATVGDGPNELIGTKAGATNLEMLKEACRENGY